MPSRSPSKPRLCKGYLLGLCMKGDACRFTHGLEPALPAAFREPRPLSQDDILCSNEYQVGEAVEVWTRTHGAWLSGTVLKVDGKRVVVRLALDGKWIGMKELRSVSRELRRSEAERWHGRVRSSLDPSFGPCYPHDLAAQPGGDVGAGGGHGPFSPQPGRLRVVPAVSSLEGAQLEELQAFESELWAQVWEEHTLLHLEELPPPDPTPSVQALTNTGDDEEWEAWTRTNHKEWVDFERFRMESEDLWGQFIDAEDRFSENREDRAYLHRRGQAARMLRFSEEEDDERAALQEMADIFKHNRDLLYTNVKNAQAKADAERKRMEALQKHSETPVQRRRREKEEKMLGRNRAMMASEDRCIFCFRPRLQDKLQCRCARLRERSDKRNLRGGRFQCKCALLSCRPRAQNRYPCKCKETQRVDFKFSAKRIDDALLLTRSPSEERKAMALADAETANQAAARRAQLARKAKDDEEARLKAEQEAKAAEEALLKAEHVHHEHHKKKKKDHHKDKQHEKPKTRVQVGGMQLTV